MLGMRGPGWWPGRGDAGRWAQAGPATGSLCTSRPGGAAQGHTAVTAPRAPLSGGTPSSLTLFTGFAMFILPVSPNPSLGTRSPFDGLDGAPWWTDGQLRVCADLYLLGRLSWVKYRKYRN